ncbi:hypothetical protein [Streptosporangium sp. NBC_01756]|uniref:hypothetical protein n=1 Tax=Streptosporangium sp. NBC_01756 TaxID=2975950 RepID=UPI002DDC1043|nr:hypothetical protein [Streptosporangium sp. NBC_01756]WSC89037.1 hypothetical protein OIE48_12845 [Streptosporangium sp. NBC_01756]
MRDGLVAVLDQVAEIRRVAYRRPPPLATGDLPVVPSEPGADADVTGVAAITFVRQP